MKAPRIMFAGTHSGSGKTTISTAIMALLTKKGFKVNPFKVGPDYIDPSYHYVATGQKGRNLDCWMMEHETVKEIFFYTAVKNDINIIEGVMGLFDGASSTSDDGSSAQIAKLTQTPVILIVDVKSTARSAAAVVQGFMNFDKEVNVAGVIVNRIGSDRHLSLVQEAIEEYCGIPVVGYIRKNDELELPSRHLGLIPTGEGRELTERITKMADIIEEGIFLEKLIKIAEKAPELKKPKKFIFCPTANDNSNDNSKHHANNDDANDDDANDDINSKVKIGLAMDEAFSFYYQDGLDILENMGAELIPFSPIHDKSLPLGLDGLYIGGGYPEIYIRELSANTTLLQDIRDFSEKGYPIYGECGGLMYLSKGISDLNDKYYSMVGIVPGRCKMKPRLVRLGYVSGTCLRRNVLGKEGTSFRGHEFHYSDIEMEPGEDQGAFHIMRNRSNEEMSLGYCRGNILASYIHIHFGTNIQLAKNFVNQCRYARRKENGKK